MDNKEKLVRIYSNPEQVCKNAFKYFKKQVPIYFSTRNNKKYMIYDPNNNTWVHFGQLPYFDFTRHQDEERRQRYLKRASNIKGEWRNNKYSPNNLSINLLW
jgi:N-acetylneuraminic acid mutarotase